MTPLVQWILVALGAVGAAGTWFRAWVAYRDQKNVAEIQRLRDDLYGTLGFVGYRESARIWEQRAKEKSRVSL